MTAEERSLGALLRDLVHGSHVGVFASEGSIAAIALNANQVKLLSDRDVAPERPDAEEFDTLVALDSLREDRPWADSVQRWLRLVRQDGRLIFDAASADHIVAVASARQISERSLLSGDSNVRISDSEIFAFAASQRVAIRAIVPYGGIHALESSSLWLRDVPALPPSALRRLLSWCEADPQLAAFVAFLERHVFGVATTSATGRFLVVIEKSEPDDAATAAKDRYLNLGRWIASGKVRLDAFAERSELGADSWFSQLRAHLEFERNRVFAALLLSRAGGVVHFNRALAELPTTALEEFKYAERMQRIDADVAAVAAVWASGFMQRELICDDVDLRGVFVDSMTHELLDRIRFSA